MIKYNLRLRQLSESTLVFYLCPRRSGLKSHTPHCTLSSRYLIRVVAVINVLNIMWFLLSVGSGAARPLTRLRLWYWVRNLYFWDRVAQCGGLQLRSRESKCADLVRRGTGASVVLEGSHYSVEGATTQDTHQKGGLGVMVARSCK